MKNKQVLIIIIPLVLLVIFAVFFYPLYNGWQISDNNNNWANFGAYLAGIGSIIASVASIGAIYGVFLTINNQNKENLKNSNENRIIKQIEFHHNICNNIRINIKRNKILEGRSAFSYLYNIALKKNYKRKKKENPNIEAKEHINLAFIDLYNKYGHQFGFYFRNLYYLIKYIDKSEHINSFYYAKLVRSQLSTPEIQLLMYNCIFNKGAGFKEYVEKYGLLNGIDINNEGNNNLEIIEEDHAKLFSETAFLSNPQKKKNS